MEEKLKQVSGPWQTPYTCLEALAISHPCEQQGATLVIQKARVPGVTVSVSVLPGGLALPENAVNWHLTERLL